MVRRIVWGGMTAAAALGLVIGVSALAREGEAGESERKVERSEVPPRALAALERLAGSASITEFAEEVEHGRKFYEGQWTGPAGHVDGLVTEAGDVVEIEEAIPAEDVPPAVRAELERAAGKGARVDVERKTLYVYEGHFERNGKEREIVLTPDGRHFLE